MHEVAPVGAWIEIRPSVHFYFYAQKSPLLGRGLKYPAGYTARPQTEVAPVGAWIEIKESSIIWEYLMKSPLLGRGLKLDCNPLPAGSLGSRPCWGVD